MEVATTTMIDVKKQCYVIDTSLIIRLLSIVALGTNPNGTKHVAIDKTIRIQWRRANKGEVVR
jgi:hypothetical protein